MVPVNATEHISDVIEAFDPSTVVVRGVLTRVRAVWGLGEEFSNEGDIERSFKVDVCTASGALGVLMGEKRFLWMLLSMFVMVLKP